MIPANIHRFIGENPIELRLGRTAEERGGDWTMTATERIRLLVTPAQKALFIKKAKASKLTLNEFVLRAGEVYDPSDDEAVMRLVAQVQTTREANAALGDALKFCAGSNRRIADMDF